MVTERGSEVVSIKAQAERESDLDRCAHKRKSHIWRWHHSREREKEEGSCLILVKLEAAVERHGINALHRLYHLLERRGLRVECAGLWVEG